MILIPLILIGAATVLAWFCWRQLCKILKFYRTIEKMPGPKAWMPLGNIREFTGEPVSLTKNVEKYILMYRDKYPLFRFWMGPVPFVAILSADANQEVLKSTALIEKSREYDGLLKQWMGDGLLISKGEKWRNRRKMITKSFHFSILDSFIPVMHEKAQICVKVMREKAQSGQGFDIAPYICQTSLDIICETAMGINVEAQTSTKHLAYLNAVKGLTNGIVSQWRYPWYWFKPLFYLLGPGFEFDRCCLTVHNFSRKIIRERRLVLNEALSHDKQNGHVTEEKDVPMPRNKMSFLDNLLAVEQENKLTESDIWEEVETFMFEGHDTTSSGIVWALFALGNHPVVQQKVFDEVSSVLGTSKECPTVDQLKEMRYLRAVIKETLRRWPTIPLFFRKVNEDFKLENYDIPKGTTLIVIPFTVQTDEKYYGPTVWDFDPDRFLDDESGESARHPFSFIVFSAGQRNCIGQKFALQEMAIVISSIIQSYRVECVTPLDGITNVSELVNKPSKPISTVLIPRD